MNGAINPDGAAPEPPPGGGRLAGLVHAFRRHVLRNTLIAAAGVTAVTTAVAVLVTSLTERVVAEDPPPSCPGTACDGRDPEEVPECGEDVGSHRPAEDNPAVLEIRYSQDCQAVWGRILNGEPGDRVTVQVPGGRVLEAEIAWGADQFTKMAGVDPDRFQAEVCAVPGLSPERQADWPRYCIEASEDTEFSLR
ncbi:DUF2690 domain-containing protein [Streptomyces mayteni]